MTRLAFFTAPKPFVDPHIQIIQRNAIRSWKALGDNIEVWLVGDEIGVAEAAHELGTGFIPEVLRNPEGTPRIDSIFNLVREKSDAEVLCYVNADILLFPDILKTLDIIQSRFNRYLVIGRRWDTLVTEALEITPGWGVEFQAGTIASAKLHRAAGSDYFMFPRGEFTDIPPFAVGRAGWDNWMIYKARWEGMALIDATNAIQVIHQNHDFSHLPNGKIHRLQPESAENMRLAGGRYAMFTIYDTNYQVNDGEIHRIRMNRWKVVREFSIFPAVKLHWPWLAKIAFALFNPGRLLKDRQQAKERVRIIEESTDEKRAKSG